MKKLRIASIFFMCTYFLVGCNNNAELEESIEKLFDAYSTAIYNEELEDLAALSTDIEKRELDAWQQLFDENDEIILTIDLIKIIEIDDEYDAIDILVESTMSMNGDEPTKMQEEITVYKDDKNEYGYTILN